jgi:putative ABC transport system substrate-binding protein
MNQALFKYRLRVAFFLLMLISFNLLGCLSGVQPNATGTHKVYKIGLVYIAPHELINQVIQGFREGLKTELPDEYFEIVEKHASGDTAQLSPTVDATIATGLDLLAPITTPISQVALKNAPSNVPICFLAVTDPIGAGLIDSVEKPVRSTGVSDLAPFELILRFVRETVPAAKTIGFPYNPEEQPAVFGRDQVLKLAPQMGFNIETKAVTSQDEFPSLIRHLTNANDALLIGSDNAMFEAASQIVKAGLDSRKPVFAGDSTSIKAGAVGGYTIDYYQVGREGAKLAARILKGEKAGDIPTIIMKEGVLELNLVTAGKLGIHFPEEVIAKAKTVYR